MDDDNRWTCSIYSLVTVVLVVFKLAGLTSLGWWVCTSPAWGAIAVYTVLQLRRLAIWLYRKTPTNPAEGNL